MKQYDHKKIEKKWQTYWAKKGVYATKENARKNKQYVLDMFPYPSGDGLHVGHPKGYIATDVYSRQARMQGKEVLHPMGWDAFGLPAENFAIKNKIHPRKAVEKNIKRFKEQLKMIGLDYDWKREINTTDPQFYKWSQWIFLKLYEKGLAYESNEPINWCPTCQTGLSNEDLEGNACERCGTVVEKRPMRQWILKITEYADRLLEDLKLLPEWQEHIKESQRNWIGKSDGVEIDFGLDLGKKYKYVYLHGYKSGVDRPRNHWYRENLEALGHSVVIPDLPNSEHPVEEEQVRVALEATNWDQNTVVVGHSLGGIVAMKALMKSGKKIAGLVLIAPAMDPEFSARAKNLPDSGRKPYHDSFNWNFDFEKIKSLTNYRTVLSDLQEPHRVQYLRELAPKLDAKLIETTSNKMHFTGDTEPDVLMWLRPTIRVFTTRPDTLYGATFLILSPEHPWVQLACRDDHADVLKNQEEVRMYVKKASEKTEIERQENKDKTGVRLEGVEAINPATGEKVPVFVADYVLSGYGTGGIMAVPAHDERDFAFAKRFDLPVKAVIEPIEVQIADRDAVRENLQFEERNAIMAVVKHWEKDEYLCLRWKSIPIRAWVTGGVEDGEDPIEAAKREIAEETGYRNAEFVSYLGGRVHAKFYSELKNINRFAHFTPMLFRLKDGEFTEPSEEEKSIHSSHWVPKNEISTFINRPDMLEVWKRVTNPDAIYTGEGILTNSGRFSGMNSGDARRAITDVFGRKKTTYKIRDWVFSRQRYWGEPIPIIHCPKDGAVPVPEKDLPVRLPEVKNYKPTGTGDSPLAAISKWVNVKCPVCKGPAKRETNTMPQWAGSSWYYLRFMDPKNKKALVDKKIEKYWAPVDLYVGGAEHATRHLIYARFWHKFLFDEGYVSTQEPFTRLISVGLIQAEDGRKMSKRFGNVINPDDIVKTYGADTLRVYEMFMGPFTDAIAWNTNSMVGARRFLERVWRLQERVSKDVPVSVEKQLHKTIKKVGEDIQTFKFNTAISTMMIFVNTAEKEGITKAQYKTFVQLLAPFAPHMAEDLWQGFGNKKSVHVSPWPTYEEKMLLEDSVKFVIQINGKVRAQVELPSHATEAEVQTAAEPLVKEWLKQRVLKVIFVPRRLINFVVAQ
jgi:leucyl-tRNA synthetase/predicted esterase YcpF (UPF0227 family)